MALPKVGIQAVIEGMGQFNKNANSIRRQYDEIDKSSSNLGRSSGGLGSSLSSLTGIIKNVGVAAGVAAAGGIAALGAGVAGFAAGGIKQAISLEQQMANIAAVMGRTTDEAGPLKDIILDLSMNPNLKVSATEAADAVELLARNGVAAGKSLEEGNAIIADMSEKTVALANATGAEFGPAADVMTDAMALFSAQGTTSAQVIDGITGVTVNSKFSFLDYADALANAGGAVAGIGLDFNDFNAIIAGTASSFKGGGEAGTAFRNLFLRLAKPTAEMTTAMDKYGISLFDSEGNMRETADVAQQLHNVFQGTATVTKTVGGVTAEMARAAEQANNKLPKLNATISEQERELAKLQREHAEVIRIYGESSPAVEDHSNKIATLNDKLALNKTEQSKLQGALTAVANAREEVVTSTVNLTEAEKAELAATIGGTRGATAVIALSKLQADSFDELSDSVNGQGQAMQSAAQRVNSVQGAWEVFKSIIQAVQIQVGDHFLPTIRELLTEFAAMASNAGPKVIEFFGNIAGVIGGAINWVRSFIGTIKGLITTFQAGGLFGSRSGSFGSEGLLAALGIPPDAISIIENIFNTVNEVIAGFQEGGVGGAFGALFSSESAGNALQGVIDFIAQFLTDNWPIVQAELSKWGNMFFDWVNSNVIPNIPTVLQGVIDGLTTFLATGGPEAIRSTTQGWVDAFWEWIESAVIVGQQELANIIASIGQWALGGGTQGQLTEFGNQIGITLVDSLITSMETLVSNADRFAAIIVQVVGGLLIGIGAVAGLLIIMGGQIVAGILQGILSAFGADLEPTTFSELAEILTGIGQNALTAATIIGTDIIQGISQGILDTIADLTTTLEQMGTIITDTVKSILGISSPSTVFMELGMNIIQGLIDGITSLMSSVPELLTNLFGELDIAGIISSIFGGGEGGDAGSIASIFTFDPAEMIAGIQTITSSFTNLTTLFNTFFLTTLPTLLPLFVTFATTVNTSMMTIITSTTTWDTLMLQMTETTIPTFQIVAITALTMINSALMMVNASLMVIIQTINVLIAAIAKLQQAFVKAMQAIEKAIKNVSKAFDDMASDISSAADKSVTAIDRIASAIDKLVSKARDATAALSGMGAAAKSSGAGAGASAHSGFGVNFQAGTDLGGFVVPPGFNNDTFPINVETGERVFVQPRAGRSVQAPPESMPLFRGGQMGGAAEQIFQLGGNTFNYPMDEEEFYTKVRETIADA